MLIKDVLMCFIGQQNVHLVHNIQGNTFCEQEYYTLCFEMDRAHRVKSR